MPATKKQNTTHEAKGVLACLSTMNHVNKMEDHNYNHDNVEEDISLLTDSINAIQSELFARQMLKERLEKKVALDAQKIADQQQSRSSNKRNTPTTQEAGPDKHQATLLYQPTELNTGNKKLLALYLDERADEIKVLLKEASGEVSLVHSNERNSDVFVNIRCGHGADYVLRLKLPESTSFGDVCTAAKDLFGIPKQVKVVLRDQMGNFFSDDVDMTNDFKMLPEQNLYLVHVTPPELAELQKYQIADMELVHTGGLSRRKRDLSRGIRIMSSLIADFPKSLTIFIIMVAWLFGSEKQTEISVLHSTIEDIFLQPRFGRHHEYTFESVTNVDHVWDYLAGPLTDAMFIKSSGVQGVIEDSTYILGSIRIRQQRVAAQSCSSRTTQMDDCYGSYHGRYSGRVTDDRGRSEYWGNSICVTQDQFYLDSSTSTSTIPPDTFNLVKTAFTNTIDATILASSGFVTDTAAEYLEGTLATYDPSGYIIEVGLDDRTTFESTIAGLKKCQWIDVATRIVYVEMNFFNPSMNTYMVGHVRFEMDPSGLVIPAFKFQALQLDIMSSTPNFISYTLECLILIWCLYQMNRWRADLTQTMEDEGSIVSWFLNVWTLLEVLIVVLFIFVFILRKTYKMDRFLVVVVDLCGLV